MAPALITAVVTLAVHVAVGPPVRAEPAESSWHTYGRGADARQYLTYRPADLAPGSPVVVWLHGCWFRGGDPTAAERVESAAATGFPALADREGFAVIFPQQPRSANSDECWNWFDPLQHWSGHGEAALLAGLVARAVEDLHADPNRVYLAGHSAGGAMTAVLGAAYPERFAALGVSAGFPAVDGLDSLGAFAGARMLERGVRGLPVAVITGDADPLSQPWIQRLVTDEWRSADRMADGGRLDVLGGLRDAVLPPAPDAVEEQPGVDGEYSRTISRYRIGPRISVDHWVFHGMAHEYPAALTTPALWRFFTAAGGP
ncbi:PHB depolymerase family esterase [Nocardia yamanashiensis]|uniref:extracellular catalytic domain type 1 short-chain-length polyhydroxyalkanoate depolymerase n=1 Tax=Nocardia yamanashiensis TaxID=209247 RepID=UPI001E5C24C9|nr:PHB depolymerase family esterase [Nocardia yamanashiensis]UGT42582.1 PHB depolymerase family esterase [Nocardia yamanashiensis]